MDVQRTILILADELGRVTVERDAAYRHISELEQKLKDKAEAPVDLPPVDVVN